MIYFLCCLLGAAVTAVISIWLWSKELKLLEEQLAELAETEKQLPKVTDPPLVFQSTEQDIVPLFAETSIPLELYKNSPAAAGQYAAANIARILGKELIRHSKIRVADEPGGDVKVVRAEARIIEPGNPGNIETIIVEDSYKMKG